MWSDANCPPIWTILLNGIYSDTDSSDVQHDRAVTKTVNIKITYKLYNPYFTHYSIAPEYNLNLNCKSKVPAPLGFTHLFDHI